MAVLTLNLFFSQMLTVIFDTDTEHLSEIL